MQAFISDLNGPVLTHAYRNDDGDFAVATYRVGPHIEANFSAAGYGGELRPSTEIVAHFARPEYGEIVSDVAYCSCPDSDFSFYAVRLYQDNNTQVRVYLNEADAALLAENLLAALREAGA